MGNLEEKKWRENQEGAQMADIEKDMGRRRAAKRRLRDKRREKVEIHRTDKEGSSR